MKREQFIAGLREMADFLEANPSFKVPRYSLTINFRFCTKDPEVGTVAKMFGQCTKFNQTNTLGLRKKFGPITLQVHWWHFDVCKRVKAGTKTVYEYPYAQPQAVVRDNYKWVCPESFVKACCEDGQ